MSNPQRDSALVLLIQSIFDQLDELAILKSKGYSGDLSSYLLKEMSSILTKLNPEEQSKYFEYIVSIGTMREMPRVTTPQSDDFVSLTTERKKNFIAKIKNKLVDAA
jgi:hypothetical protein